MAQKILAADRGRDAAIAAFLERINNKPKRIDNASLAAGSPMYYYCRICEHLSDTVPEGYFLSSPASLCDECKALKEQGWLPDALEAAKL